MDELRAKLGAADYLGGRLQLLGTELQGLGYQLSGMQQNSTMYLGRDMTKSEFHNIAGTVARLHAQIERTLQVTKQLMFEAETIAPKDR